ncbi:MAG: adenosylcobinamide-GDP ribazoletransferase [Rhodobacteraceae bacterium]|nr:adenosylcobinamide-GDP ribazoletransferase [Paracoccaceae bacterium]
MYQGSGNKGFAPGDILVALGLLSRIPVSVDPELAVTRAATATWAYPLVGAVLGGLAGLVGSILLELNLPSGMAAALALGVLVLLSGAMHEDGLADCADGLGGGHDRERRLEIMKDSRIGAFGAVALVIVLLARWAGLGSLAPVGLFWPMLAIGAVSRLPMILAMYGMQPARADGLSAGVGTPPPGSVLAALGIGLAIAVLTLGGVGFLVLLIACLAPLPLFWLAQERIGGQTGDILGGSQQLAEIAALATLAAWSV